MKSLAIKGAIAAIAIALGFVSYPTVRSWLGISNDGVKLPSTRNSAQLDPIPKLSPWRTTPSSPGMLAGVPATSAPRTRAGAQQLARNSLTNFSRFVQNFEAGTENSPWPDTFYLTPDYSGYPGLCSTMAMTVLSRPDGYVAMQPRFLVVGSFSSPKVAIDRKDPAQPAYKAWEDTIKANCRAREADHNWFTVTGQGFEAGEVARTVDGVVAAARGSGGLPFKLDCGVENEADRIFCAEARKKLGKLDPRTIASARLNSAVYEGILHREMVVSMQGDPYVVITVREESPVPGTIVWTLKYVGLREEMQPIIN
jgi:hypothetical protein